MRVKRGAAGGRSGRPAPGFERQRLSRRPATTATTSTSRPARIPTGGPDAALAGSVGGEVDPGAAPADPRAIAGCVALADGDAATDEPGSSVPAGAVVGSGVGLAVGVSSGVSVGSAVGLRVGFGVGFGVGLAVGFGVPPVEVPCTTTVPAK